MANEESVSPAVVISRLAGQNLAQFAAIGAVFTHIATKSPAECAVLKQHLANAAEANRKKCPAGMPDWTDAFDGEIDAYERLLGIIAEAHRTGEIQS